MSHAGWSASSHLRSGGTHSSSAVASFRTGSSTGTGTYLVAVPVAIAGCVPCDDAAQREPSRSVCSISRKSKRFTVGIVYLPVQRVPGPCPGRSAQAAHPQLQGPRGEGCGVAQGFRSNREENWAPQTGLARLRRRPSGGFIWSFLDSHTTDYGCKAVL